MESLQSRCITTLAKNSVRLDDYLKDECVLPIHLFIKYFENLPLKVLRKMEQDLSLHQKTYSSTNFSWEPTLQRIWDKKVTSCDYSGSVDARYLYWMDQSLAYKPSDTIGSIAETLALSNDLGIKSLSIMDECQVMKLHKAKGSQAWLKSITRIFICFREYTDEEFMSAFLQWIYKSCPKLESIQLRSFDENVVNHIISVLEIRRKENPKWPLVHLKIKEKLYFNPHHITRRALMVCRAFDLDIDYEDEDEEPIDLVLMCYNSISMTSYLQKRSNKSPISRLELCTSKEFPEELKLPAIKELVLYQSYGNYSNSKKDYDYPLIFPPTYHFYNLRELTIRDGNVDLLDLVDELKESPTVRLEKLDIFIHFTSNIEKNVCAILNSEELQKSLKELRIELYFPRDSGKLSNIDSALANFVTRASSSNLELLHIFDPTPNGPNLIAPFHKFYGSLSKAKKLKSFQFVSRKALVEDDGFISIMSSLVRSGAKMDYLMLDTKAITPKAVFKTLKLLLLVCGNNPAVVASLKRKRKSVFKLKVLDVRNYKVKDKENLSLLKELRYSIVVYTSDKNLKPKLFY